MFVKLKLARLRAMEWFALRSDCLAHRWGLVGIMRASITEGPDRGRTLGYSIAANKVRGA